MPLGVLGKFKKRTGNAHLLIFWAARSSFHGDICDEGGIDGETERENG